MSNSLNSVSLYCKLVDELKTVKVGVVRETVLLLSIIWFLNTLLARVLMTVIDSEPSS